MIGQGEAAASGAAAARDRVVAAAKAAVGLLPQSSLISHLSERLLIFFLQMTARVCGGVSSPLIEPKMGRERKGPT